MTFKNILATGETYHIFNRSLIGKQTFVNQKCFFRFIKSMQYYQQANPPIRLSHFLRTPQKPKLDDENKLVENLCYSVMPDHFHLVLTQLVNHGISIFVNRFLNSYTRYYNTKYKRKGPLWQGRFKRVRVTSDEQLLHLTRYIHLNPVTAYLVENPSDYPFSSYNEYLKLSPGEITAPQRVLGKNYSPQEYKKFVLAQKKYQRELKKIKDLLLD